MRKSKHPVQEAILKVIDEVASISGKKNMTYEIKTAGFNCWVDDDLLKEAHKMSLNNNNTSFKGKKIEASVTFEAVLQSPTDPLFSAILNAWLVLQKNDPKPKEVVFTAISYDFPLANHKKTLKRGSSFF
jgi:hypothetical protein